jgi:sulfate permease, SulP family
MDTQAVTEILSGMTIAFIMIPEAIAFALLLGLTPAIGLKTSIVMSFITSILSGQPGLISGATGAVASALKDVATKFGTQHIFVTVIMAGIIQALAGIFKLHKLFDLIPEPVVSGFLIGLAVLIFQGQIPHFKKSNNEWMSKESLLHTGSLTLLGIIIIQVSNYIPLPIKLPGSLIAIIVIGAISYYSPKKLYIETLADKGDVTNAIPKFEIPKIKDLDLKTILKLLPYALGMAIAGLTESVIMVKEVNKLLNRKASTLRETFAQGVANITSGFTGGFGGCVLVGQSKINISNGARGRLSSFVAFLMLICIVLFFSSYLKFIPMPALIAIMIIIVYQTGDWKSLSKNVGGLAWITTIGTATVSIITHNLGMGVVSGSIGYMLAKSMGVL